MDQLVRWFDTRGKAVRLAYATILAAVSGAGMTHLRGPVLGLLVFVVFGLLSGIWAVSISWVRRWSADHIVADASLIVPFIFFALLAIPVLPWWAAALIALAIGVVIVPFMVRRRRAYQARTASQTDS
ncbi:hypothetical protein [Dactylosporangium sp. NPDC048998]|uniref:hypothetical protein n=1 Tax=Dactylosporangium sp. NPDC048998 TaxID=3363976 RepID=UPI00371BCC04